MDTRTFLKSLPGFEGFTPRDLDALAAVTQVRLYPKGHQFIAQGEQGQALYLIMTGAVLMTRVDELTGFRQERELRAGETFGLLSLLDNLPAAATCSALDAVSAVSLPRVEFNELFDAAPTVGHHLLYLVAIQLARDLQDRNTSLRSLLREQAHAATMTMKAFNPNAPGPGRRA
ncbi:MAG: cyclic nucleotide-binding domain-containing protein [Betaproteobacteria bacterium]|nr:cyclic nucleotide-binding domain-containing protein [Betaproteobacteria bacterium]